MRRGGRGDDDGQRFRPPPAAGPVYLTLAFFSESWGGTRVGVRVRGRDVRLRSRFVATEARAFVIAAVHMDTFVHVQCSRAAGSPEHHRPRSLPCCGVHRSPRSLPSSA